MNTVNKSTAPFPDDTHTRLKLSKIGHSSHLHCLHCYEKIINNVKKQLFV